MIGILRLYVKITLNIPFWKLEAKFRRIDFDFFLTFWVHDVILNILTFKITRRSLAKKIHFEKMAFQVLVSL